MGVPELRQELHNFINQADERFLKMIHALSIEYDAPVTIGYNTDGTAINERDLRDRVKAASRRVKAGDYITQEEIKKEVENW